MSDNIIEAEAEVISTKKKKSTNRHNTGSTKPKQNPQPDNPFAGMAGMEGMPDLASMFNNGGMPDLSKLPGLPLKQRIMFKLMCWSSSPKLRFLKSRWSAPIWGIIALVIFAIVLIFGTLFLVWKLLKAILSAYLPSKQ